MHPWAALHVSFLYLIVRLAVPRTVSGDLGCITHVLLHSGISLCQNITSCCCPFRISVYIMVFLKKVQSTGHTYRIQVPILVYDILRLSVSNWAFLKMAGVSFSTQPWISMWRPYSSTSRVSLSVCVRIDSSSSILCLYSFLFLVQIYWLDLSCRFIPIYLLWRKLSSLLFGVWTRKIAYLNSDSVPERIR